MIFEKFRRRQKLMLIFILVFIALPLIVTIPMGEVFRGRGEVVGKIFDTEIHELDLHEFIWRWSMVFHRGQIDPESSEEMAWQNLILYEAARRAGVGASDTEIDQFRDLIFALDSAGNLPFFNLWVGMHGFQQTVRQFRQTTTISEHKFDKQLFKDHLKSIGLTEKEYRDILRKRIIIEKYLDFLCTPAVPTSEEVFERFQRENEKVKIRFVKLPLEMFEQQLHQASEEELEAYYEKHKEQKYMWPEERKFDVLFIELEKLREIAEDPTEEWMLDYYERHKETEFVRTTATEPHPEPRPSEVTTEPSPVEGTTESSPAEDTIEPPPAEGTMEPPPAEDATEPPQAEGTTEPSPTEGTADSPPSEDTTELPSEEGKLESPPAEGTTEPSQTEGTDSPPSENRSEEQPSESAPKDAPGESYDPKKTSEKADGGPSIQIASHRAPVLFYEKPIWGQNIARSGEEIAPQPTTTDDTMKESAEAGAQEEDSVGDIPEEETAQPPSQEGEEGEQLPAEGIEQESPPAETTAETPEETPSAPSEEPGEDLAGEQRGGEVAQPVGQGEEEREQPPAEAGGEQESPPAETTVETPGDTPSATPEKPAKEYKSFEEVRSEIFEVGKKDSMRRLANDVFTDILHDLVDDPELGFAEIVSMRDYANYHVSHHTISGVTRENMSPIEALCGSSDEFRTTAFSVETMEVSNVCETDIGIFIFRVLEITPPRPKEFESVRGEVEKDWKREQAEKKAEEKAIRIVEDIRKSSFEEIVVNREQLKVRYPEPFLRTGSIADDIGYEPKLSEKAFQLEAGQVDFVRVGDTWYVLECLKKIPPWQEDFEAQMATIRSDLYRSKFSDLRRSRVEQIKSKSNFQRYERASVVQEEDIAAEEESEQMEE